MANKAKPNLKELFNFMSANDVLSEAKDMENPKNLWDEFWMEGEVCCLFADTNLGKTILAVQIGNSIAEKLPNGENVLYYDFELSKKQFERRYRDEKSGEAFKFSDSFIRVELNTDVLKDITSMPMEDAIMCAMEESIKAYNSKVIIVDNITWLTNMKNSSFTAGKLMQKLCILKKKYNLSLLVLAHTNKRNVRKSIEIDNLNGSKRFSNFFDSMFAIGRCANGENMRYLKQLKVRSAEFKYGKDNVDVCSLEKDGALLHFVHKKYSTERKELLEGKGESSSKDKGKSVEKKMKKDPNRYAKRSVMAQNQITFIDKMLAEVEV